MEEDECKPEGACLVEANSMGEHEGACAVSAGSMAEDGGACAGRADSKRESWSASAAVAWESALSTLTETLFLKFNPVSFSPAFEERSRDGHPIDSHSRIADARPCA